MKRQLRLMSLGGSITQGVGSTDRNGYRGELRKLLKLHGYNVQMVGSRHIGLMEDNAHEGWRGFRLDEIEVKARRCVSNMRPNLFTVNAGSNDCLQGFQLDEIGARMANLLEYLWSASAGSTVILSTLVVNRDPEVNARIAIVNNAYRALVNAKAAEKKRIILADMYPREGPAVEDLCEDDTHPGDPGYKKMAGIWFRAIEDAESRGLIL